MLKLSKKYNLFLSIIFTIFICNKSYAAENTWSEQKIKQYTENYNIVKSDTIEFKYDGEKRETIENSSSELGILNYYLIDINGDGKKDFITTLIDEHDDPWGEHHIFLTLYVYLAEDVTPTFAYSWSLDNIINKKISLMLKNNNEELYLITSERYEEALSNEINRNDIIHIYKAGNPNVPFLYAYSDYNEISGETLYAKDYINEPDSTDFIIYSNYYNNTKFEKLEDGQNYIKNKLKILDVDNLMTILSRNNDTSISFIPEHFPNNIMPIITLEEFPIAEENNIYTFQIKVIYKTTQELKDRITQLKITPSKIKLNINETENIAINDNSEIIDYHEIEWIIDNEEIAKLEFDGEIIKVRGVKEGITTITAKLENDLFAKCEIMVTNDDKNEIENKNEIFYEDSKGNYKYTGNIIDNDKSYVVEGNLILDKSMEIPRKTKIYVQGNIQVNDEIVFNKNVDSQNNINQFSELSCDGDFKVNSKGLIDLSRGGNIVIGKDFIFNSAINHKEYLYNGKIQIGGNLIIKRNFYASENNKIEILCNEKKIHTINVNKKWFNPTQSLGILHILNGGLETIDIVKKFNCEKIISDNWNILKGNFYDEDFNLTRISGPIKCDEQIIENIQSSLMRIIYEGGYKIPFIDDFSFVSIDKKGEEFFYYDNISNKIKNYKIDVYYNGTKMNGIAGFGTITYYENNQSYKYAISFSKDTMKKMQQDFINISKKTYVNSVKDELKANLFKGMIKSKLYSDFYDLTENLSEMNEVANGDKPDILIQCLLDNKDNLNKYRNLIE